MLSYCALYHCITIPTIFQNSPQKSSGKGSLLLPCPKMPIGIFLFSLKSEFKKSEEKGKKRRKPEKISGFSVGIFFVNSSWRRHPKYSPLANISHLAVGRQATAALRWRCEVAPPRFAGRSHFKKTSDFQIKKHPRGVLFDLEAPPRFELSRLRWSLEDGERSSESCPGEYWVAKRMLC